MIIQKISLINVRKIEYFSIQPSPSTTIIIGKNGTGKTTILEAIFFLLTTKSFRKKYNKSIIKNNKNTLQIKGKIETKEKRTLIITSAYNGKKKTIKTNNQPIKKTSELLEHTNIVSVSPEEPDVVEIYKQEKIKYFDKIIFKINPHFIKLIKKYNKLLKIRNALLETNQPTTPWDAQIAEAGIGVWNERKKFFKNFTNQQKKTEKNITKTNKYTTKYTQPKTDKIKDYILELKKTKNNHKTTFGPHQDNTLFLLKDQPLQERGSQGEKKLFKYILKLTEAEILEKEKQTKPILLLDDFFAKLDDENIMKIFTFFHRKFQTIITTTTIKETTVEKEIKNAKKPTIKTIKIDDKTFSKH